MKANTSQKQHQFKEQQFLTATLKRMVCLKTHTNKLFQFDRVTFSAAPLTQPCGKLTKSLCSINMKILIFTFFTLFLLSSCATLSSDDQFVSLSSNTDQETLIVKVYNREKGANDIVTIKIDKSVHQDISINSQQVVTILLDVVEGKKSNAILLFSLPTGKTIEKNIDAKVNDKVFIIIEDNAVIELNYEDWYEKLNKDRAFSPIEQVLVVVFSPIIVPIALVSLMFLTLVGG